MKWKSARSLTLIENAAPLLARHFSLSICNAPETGQLSTPLICNAPETVQGVLPSDRAASGEVLLFKSKRTPRIFAHSEASHQGRENQDCLAHREIGGVQFLALADGMGGQFGGARAAQIAVSTSLASIACARNPFHIAALRAAFERADKAVEAHSEAGFTTFILCGIARGRVLGISSGDSVALQISPNSETELTEKQCKNPAMGTGAALGTVFENRMKSGEQLLLMSDGVFRFVGMERIAPVCRESQDEAVLADLLALQSRTGGALPDDWSAMLARV